MEKFHFKKKYGQNFLQNEEIANAIVDSINPSSKDLIIEIGPGAGAITQKLKKYKAKLVAFEIDETVKNYLIPLEDENTKIIYKDFMNVNLKEELSNIDYENLYVVGNLPYYITTPIIEHIIESKIDLESLTIMVQKEVAERFMALPRTREYGYMTVLLKFHFDIKKIIDVPRKYFYPIPKVDSSVVKLSKKEKNNIDYNKFKMLLKDSFQFKRKTLRNNLKGYNLDKIEQVLNNHNYTLDNRAEEIDLDTYMDLVKYL